MKLFDVSLLLFIRDTTVAVFNLNTREESVVAGGDSRGNAIGSLEHTSFNYGRGLLKWNNEKNTLLLVADYSYNRFADLS